MAKYLQKIEHTWIHCGNRRVYDKIRYIVGRRCVGAAYDGAYQLCMMVDVSDFDHGTWRFARWILQAWANVLRVFMSDGYAIRGNTIVRFEKES